MTESPSALLERAAALIEQRASLAAPGPWDASEGSEIYAADGFCVVSTHWDGAGFERSDDQDWCAMLSPAVAPPLVEWLRETVEQYRTEHSRRTVPSVALDEAWTGHPAVRFARLVLGEPENMP